MLPGKPKNHTPHYAATPPNEALDAMMDALKASMNTLHDWMEAHPVRKTALAMLGAQITQYGIILERAVVLEKHQRQYCECTPDTVTPAPKQRTGFTVGDHLPDAIKNRIKNRFDLN